jgi:hypothetical protein
MLSLACFFGAKKKEEGGTLCQFEIRNLCRSGKVLNQMNDRELVVMKEVKDEVGNGAWREKEKVEK